MGKLLTEFKLLEQRFVRIRFDEVERPNGRITSRSWWHAKCIQCGEHWTQSSRGTHYNPSRFARRRCNKCLAKRKQMLAQGKQAEETRPVEMALIASEKILRSMVTTTQPETPASHAPIPEQAEQRSPPSKEPRPHRKGTFRAG